MSHHPAVEASPLARFGIALLAVGIALLGRLAMTPLMSYRFPFVTFFPAILVSAWYGGFWPGIFSTLLGTSLVVAIWFLPVSALDLAHAGDLIAVVMFVGTGIAMAGVYESLRRQKAAQQAARIEAERAADEAKRAQREADAANRAKDEFLSVLSHELRTPLTAILGWTTMLRTFKPDPATQARAIEAIERNSLAQARLIEDIFDVSRIVMGKLRLDVRPTSLGALVSAALELAGPAAEAKGIALEGAIAPDLGLIRADPDRLQQILWNLLSNSIKFTPPGGRITVQVVRRRSQLQIRIVDTGTGISADFLPHVFERFRQADASSTRPHSGIGLGLALVKHLVELHGGSVAAESDGPGKGATFTVCLPVQPTSPERAEEAVPEVALRELGAASLEGIRVLVVDDEPDILDLVATILGGSGAKVVVAASAAEALRVLESTAIEVLISDIVMPDEDGYTLMAQVTALLAKQKRRMPAVALTACAGKEDANRAYRAGFLAHVAKPVAAERLVATVARLATAAPLHA